MPNLRGKTWTTTTPANVGDAQYWEDHLISDEQNAKITSSVQSVNGSTPDPSGNVTINPLPDGGTEGQILVKVSSTAGDADWETKYTVPAGGSTGQVLVKATDTSGDTEWETMHGVPNFGNTGQVLIKHSDVSGDTEWTSMRGVPDGGTTGQVLTKGDEGEIEWMDPASSGHTVQNASGQDMPYQEILQFRRATVTNDATNGKTIVDCRGEKGEDGQSAYAYALIGGYQGSEAQFYEDLGNFEDWANTAESSAIAAGYSAEAAADSIREVRQILAVPTFTVNFTTGEVIYDFEQEYTFSVNYTTGNLEWEVI